MPVVGAYVGGLIAFLITSIITHKGYMVYCIFNSPTAVEGNVIYPELSVIAWDYLYMGLIINCRWRACWSYRYTLSTTVSVFYTLIKMM